MVPLTYRLGNGDIVEILTSNQDRGPSRDWLQLVGTSSARNKIRAFFRREKREDAERRGRNALHDTLRKRGLPEQKVASSPLIADVMRDMGFKKADEFYVALGEAKISAKVVANKIMQRLKQGEGVEGEEDTSADHLVVRRAQPRGLTEASSYGIKVKGIDDVPVRLAKCCRPVTGDPIVGYISLGRGITIHRSDCNNARALARNGDRFTDVSWEGGNLAAYRAEVEVQAYDRARLLEDISRTMSEAGANIISARLTTNPPMVKNRFVIEVVDAHQLKQTVSRLRQVESVFDAFRVTPTSD
jgi:GTP pyrophosphokinase